MSSRFPGLSVHLCYITTNKSPSDKPREGDKQNEHIILDDWYESIRDQIEATEDGDILCPITNGEVICSSALLTTIKRIRLGDEQKGEIVNDKLNESWVRGRYGLPGVLLSQSQPAAKKRVGFQTSYNINQYRLETNMITLI